MSEESEVSLVHAGEPQLPAVPVTPSPSEFETLVKLAGSVSNTEFVPADLRGKPHAVLACILSGRELGVGPMQSLQKISIIKGRPAPSAELMRALVIKAGHRLWTEEYTDTVVTLATVRRGDPETRVQRVSWGQADSQRAGLNQTGGMHGKYPRAMYLARATSELCRMVYPEVLAGFSYAPEDLEGLPDPPATPQRASVTNSRDAPAAESPVNPVAEMKALEAQFRELAAAAGHEKPKQDAAIKKCVTAANPTARVEQFRKLVAATQKPAPTAAPETEKTPWEIALTTFNATMLALNFTLEEAGRLREQHAEDGNHADLQALTDSILDGALDPAAELQAIDGFVDPFTPAPDAPQEPAQ